MTSRDSASSEITPEVLLRAYACGIFPMAESADDPTLFWVEPEMRGVIPLDGFRISSRLAMGAPKVELIYDASQRICSRNSALTEC